MKKVILYGDIYYTTNHHAYGNTADSVEVSTKDKKEIKAIIASYYDTSSENNHCNWEDIRLYVGGVKKRLNSESWKKICENL